MMRVSDLNCPKTGKQINRRPFSNFISAMDLNGRMEWP